MSEYFSENPKSPPSSEDSRKSVWFLKNPFTRRVYIWALELVTDIRIRRETAPVLRETPKKI